MSTGLIVSLSLGAGVQSSVTALMASEGLITPMPNFAIFADTQWEPQSVYDWLDWLKPRLAFPVYTVTKGDLKNDNLRIVRSKKSGKLYHKSEIPAHILKPSGGHGMLPRHCTVDYKINPIIKKLRELTKKQPTEQWIGISTDEAHRMKPAKDPWITNRWPLIELGMSRDDCLKWMEERGYPRPPRSACIACPYHSDFEWARLKKEEPMEFLRAAYWEKKYQEVAADDDVTTGVPFLHSSCKPLETVEFKTDDPKQNLFGNECEGMCGV